MVDSFYTLPVVFIDKSSSGENIYPHGTRQEKLFSHKYIIEVTFESSS